MSDFSQIEQITAVVVEEHQFPLYELTGLYQRLYAVEQGISVESIIVDLHEAAGKTDEDILNLVVASGYVAEDSDITFRSTAKRDYLYTYFNFKQDEEVEIPN